MGGNMALRWVESSFLHEDMAPDGAGLRGIEYTIQHQICWPED
jgi:hypothetical protein